MKLLEKIQERPFFKNVLTLSIGTGLAHAITFFAQFILMKLYTPAQIGVVATFVAFVSIISIVLTGRYDQAIVIPKDDKKGWDLVVLSMIINTCLSLVFMLPLLFFKPQIVSVFDLNNLGVWVWFIPFTAWSLAGYNILFYWHNRKTEYKKMSASKVVETSSRAVIQIGSGVISKHLFGLMLGRIVGHFLAFLYFIVSLKNKTQLFKSVSLQSIKAVAKQYIHFPKHLLVTQGIAAFYFQIPILFIAWFFGEKQAGFFSTASMFVGIPGLLIARSVGDVFRQRAAELYAESGQFTSLVKQTIKHTFVVGIIPFILIIILSPFVFEWYQAEWKLTGVYIAILAVNGFFSFVITPVDKVAFVVEKTTYLFYWHLSRLSFYAIICLLTYKLNLSPINYLWLLVVVDIIHYLIELRYSFKYSRGVNN